MMARSEPVPAETRTVNVRKLPTLHKAPSEGSAKHKKKGQSKKPSKSTVMYSGQDIEYSLWDSLDPTFACAKYNNSPLSLRQIEAYVNSVLGFTSSVGVEVQTVSIDDFLLYTSFLPGLAAEARDREVPLEALLRYVQYMQDEEISHAT